MLPLTREQIVACFSKKEQKKLKLPDLEKIDWKNLDYLGWLHRDGHLGYLVAEYQGKLIGLELKIEKTLNDNKYKMCSICLTQHLGGGVSLFTTKNKIRKTETVGDYFCANLNCGLYLRSIEKSWAIQIREHIDRQAKIDRANINLEKFINKIFT